MAPPATAGEVPDVATCQSAGLGAERDAGLPSGLLHAIGLVESGRPDPVTNRRAAWPWTINADGAGRLFETLPDALAQTRDLQRRGITSIDVGCFQINLQHHPAAFSSLEQAFDPAANAAYAARFLLALRARTGSWDSAVAAYHSATPERGSAYRDRVMAAWSAAGDAAADATPAVSRVLVWMQSSPGAAMRVWRPSAAGAAAGMIVIRQAADGTGAGGVGAAAAPVASPRPWLTSKLER
jgi:hypothetical protein